jgi:hypothetical protein
VSTKDVMAFVRKIQAGEFDAAAVFADWLEEQDDPVARNYGILLRRRWKRWQKEREKEIAEAKRKEREIVGPLMSAMRSLKASGFAVEVSVAKAVVAPTNLAGFRFRRYVQERWPLPEYWDEFRLYAAPGTVPLSD